MNTQKDPSPEEKKKYERINSICKALQKALDKVVGKEPIEDYVLMCAVTNFALMQTQFTVIVGSPIPEMALAKIEKAREYYNKQLDAIAQDVTKFVAMNKGKDADEKKS